MVSAARRASVLHGGSVHPASHYATSSAVATLGAAQLQRQGGPAAQPWMSVLQSKHGSSSSGFAAAYYRDAPPGDGKLAERTTTHGDFSRPQTAPLQKYLGDKNREPLTACLHRGDDKEPRYYPLALGAQSNAKTLVEGGFTLKGHGAQMGNRGGGPSIFGTGGGKVLQPKTIKTAKPLQPSSGFVAAASEAAHTLITAPQSDGIARSPALTRNGAERVAADSTRRYLHARDFHDAPFLSSKNHFDDDAAHQHEANEAKKATKRTELSSYPETQFALMRFSPHTKPFAEDVGVNPRSCATDHEAQSYGVGVRERWGTIPSQGRDGLLPTGYASNHPEHTRTLTAETNESPADGMQFLPERFLRLRKRHDYLHWGGEAPFETTVKMELKHPRVQVPVAGKRDEGDVHVMYDSRRSGYEMNVNAQSPITPDMPQSLKIAALLANRQRPVTAG